LVAIVGLLFLWFYPGSSVLAARVLALPIDGEETVHKAEERDSWPTYCDQQDGYCLRYPVSWFLYPAPTGNLPRVTQLYSYDREVLPAVGMPVPSAEVKLEIAVLPNEEQKSIAEWLQSSRDLQKGLDRSSISVSSLSLNFAR